MSVTGGSEGYCLSLADGQRWNLVPTGPTRDWAANAARIMGLPPCGRNDGRKILFVRGYYDSWAEPSLDREAYPELNEYPLEGWSAQKIGLVRIWTHKDLPDVVCELFDRDVRRNLDYHYEMRHSKIWWIIQSLFPIYDNVMRNGGSALHAAMFELDGKGALIMAKSGTGKSTCFRRIETPWRAIADEEALVVRFGDQYLMHPMPTWSDFIERGMDYTRDVQGSVPLSGIFFLEQAPADEVEPLGKGKAAMNLYESSEQICTKYFIKMEKEQNIAFRKRLLDNAFEISRRVPSFTLKASLTGRFWDEMEKVLV